MIKKLNESLKIEEINALEERLATELEDRIELGCWAYCEKFCIMYS